jgi:hypothetical protein
MPFCGRKEIAASCGEYSGPDGKHRSEAEEENLLRKRVLI